MVPLDEAPPPPRHAARQGPGVVDALGSTSPPAARSCSPGCTGRRTSAPTTRGAAPATRRGCAVPAARTSTSTGKALAQPTDNASRRYYQSFADVTEAGGRGRPGRLVGRRRRRERDRQRTRTRPTTRAGRSSSCYADPASRRVRDRLRRRASGSARRARRPPFEFAADAGTPARIGVVAWEGDRTGTGDRLVLGDTCLGRSAARRCSAPSRRRGGTGRTASDDQRLRLDGDRLAGRQLARHRRQGVRTGQTLACDVSSLTATTAGDQYLIGAITLRSTPVPRRRVATRPAEGQSARSVTAATAASMGTTPPTSSSASPAVRGSCSSATSTAATSARGTEPRGTESSSRTDPVGGVVGEAAGAQDRPVEVARPQVELRGPLGDEVGGEHLVGPGRRGCAGAHRRDQHVPPHPGLLGAVGQQPGRRPVHGVLAGDPAARAGAGGEHDGVGTRDRLGHVPRVRALQVEDHRLGAVRDDVVDVRRADAPARRGRHRARSGPGTGAARPDRGLRRSRCAWHPR